MRKTFASWNEIVQFIKNNKSEDTKIVMTPVSWYGEMAKDRKTKMLKSEVENVYSIIFDVEIVDK